MSHADHLPYYPDIGGTVIEKVRVVTKDALGNVVEERILPVSYKEGAMVVELVDPMPIETGGSISYHWITL